MFPKLMEELIVYHRNIIVDKSEYSSNKTTVITVEDRQSLTGITFLHYKDGCLFKIERDVSMRKLLIKKFNTYTIAKLIVVFIHFIIFIGGSYLINQPLESWYPLLLYYTLFLPLIPYSRWSIIPIVNIIINIVYPVVLAFYYILPIYIGAQGLTIVQSVIWFIVATCSLVFMLASVILNIDIATKNILYNRIRKKNNM
ncbi:hypothetical protein [Clostridium tertium]|uniref:hypothetical protein n=1 Tax=Clostridium tertium TaxID=1559 RepID=UPI0023B25DB8|nr:hypothetical protein [Clostridium tertium]